MGLVYIEGVVKHGGRHVKVRFLVDSGATYTVLTKSAWEELGLRPMGDMEFVLADGTVIRRSISEAILELPGFGERHTPVVLGESEDENLLGMVTLEIFGLILDPFRRELRPIRALMKSTSESHTDMHFIRATRSSVDRVDRDAGFSSDCGPRTV